MLTEDQFISYYEKLARAHRTIAHEADGVKSFFEVEDPDELTSFDAAVRNATGSTVMLLVAGEGELDDNGSNNYVQVLECDIYILQKKTFDLSVHQIRSTCIQAITDILTRTKKDASAGRLVPGKITNFNIKEIPVRQIGPVNLQWYGYAAKATFTCPFGWKVDSGTWTDIP